MSIIQLKNVIDEAWTDEARRAADEAKKLKAIRGWGDEFKKKNLAEWNKVQKELVEKLGIKDIDNFVVFAEIFAYKSNVEGKMPSFEEMDKYWN